MQLIIGNKRWSTWSLRPWLVLRKAGADFSEVELNLRQGDATAAAIAPHSPSGKVPALKVGDLVIWDSLAISEYVAEAFPQARLWPTDPAARARARAASAEMHSGFASLRGEFPMALDEAPHVKQPSEATAQDLRRISALFNDLLTRHGGPFLGGAEWSIVDAFFTPVATRLRTYGVRLSDYGDTGPAGEYVNRLLADPDFRVWEAAARGAAT